MSTLRLHLSLFWYNHFRRHWNHWRVKRMWVAEGRDPARCFKSGPISVDDVRWAESVAKEAAASTPSTRPYHEWRRNLRP